MLSEMRLVVPVESRSLLSQLRSEGLEVEVLHECGVSLVSLAPSEVYGPSQDRRTVYPLPSTLARFSRSSLGQIFRLYGAERGGSGFATVICGASGRAVKPSYKVPELSPDFSQVQAVFLVHGSGVSLSVSKGSKKVTIHQHYVLIQNGFIVLTTQMWRVGGNRLPRPLSGFDRAIKALREKASSPVVGVFYADGVRKPESARRAAEPATV